MRRIAVAAATALALAGGAHAAQRGSYLGLPSPLALLSPAPPLAGGASASAEGFRHRVTARTTVDVSLDSDGTPFAVRATQRLDVRVVGDYFFTIGAPVLDVEAAPGSAATPGLRATSILWAGFNPGRRTLIARATLDPAASAPSLPLRVERNAGRVTLVNQTGATANAYTAEALVPPLVRYLAQLRREIARGRLPTSGGAYVTSKPTSVRRRVVAPLHVVGTIGSRTVDAVVGGRLVVNANGPVDLRVTTLPPSELLDAPTAGLTGRALLERATRAALTLARAAQYDAFLGNPDPTGSSRTTYAYRTAARPVPPPVAAAASAHGRNWTMTIAVAAGLLLAAGGALVAWSRS